MFLALSAGAYCAAAYYFANSRLSDRLAEAETHRDELRAVAVTLAAPVAVTVELVAAVFYRVRHTLEAARRLRESGS